MTQLPQPQTLTDDDLQAYLKTLDIYSAALAAGVWHGEIDVMALMLADLVITTLYGPDEAPNWLRTLAGGLQAEEIDPAGTGFFARLMLASELLKGRKENERNS